MNDYVLGIMWSIGTLQKNTNRYFVQTFDKDKVCYLEKIAELKGKNVAVKERTSRGKTRTMYTIFISDENYALQLRDMGYDDPKVEIPEGVDDNFMAAMLELSIVRYTNGKNKYGEYGYDFFRINSDNCEAWNNYLERKFGINKRISTTSVDTINFGRNDMLKIAEYMVNVEKSNKDFWNDMISTCRTLVM